MAGNDVRITLVVDGDTVKIQEATAQIDKMGDAAQASGERGAASMKEMAGAMALGQIAANTLMGMFRELGNSLGGAFRAGIAAIGDFERQTISVAATLADLAADKNNVGQAYAQSLKYSKEMFRELELEAAKHFASGKELQEGMNILTQKGVVLRQEDIGALATVIDKVKLMTQGQQSSIQIAQELRALLDGQARQTSQLAMLVKDQLGPGWEDLIRQHKEAGDLLQWIAGLFPGLQSAVGDIQNTLEAQQTTLSTHLRYIGREGLAGMYDDIVGLVKSINEYLKEHGAEIAGTIAAGWQAVKELVGGVLQIIKDIHAYVVTPLVWVIKVVFETMVTGPMAGMAGWLAGGVGGGGDISQMGGGDLINFGKETGYNRGGWDSAAGEGAPGSWGNIPAGLPALKKPPGGGKGGGGGRGGGGKSAEEDWDRILEQDMREAHKAWKDFNDTMKDLTKIEKDTAKFMSQVRREGGEGDFERLAGRKWTAKDFESIEGGIEKGGVWTATGDKAGSASSVFKDVGKIIGTDVMKAMTGDAEALGKMGIQIAETLGKKAIEFFTTTLGSVFEDILGDVAKTVTDMLKEGLKSLMDSAKDILSSIFEGIGGLGGGGGGGPFSMIGEAIGGLFGIFHHGGLVMHEGGSVPWVYAHAGLNLAADEVPVIAQRGEYVLPRDAVSRIGSGRLDALRRGESPGSGVVVMNNNFRHQMTPGEWQRAVRLYVIPALNREATRRGG